TALPVSSQARDIFSTLSFGQTVSTPSGAKYTGSLVETNFHRGICLAGQALRVLTASPSIERPDFGGQHMVNKSEGLQCSCAKQYQQRQRSFSPSPQHMRKRRHSACATMSRC